MSLFPEKDKSRFLQITGGRFDALKQRMAGKGLPPPPFTKDQFRNWMLRSMGDGFRYDAPIQCRYCHGLFDIAEVVGDHAIPIVCGGSLGLENLEFPCTSCNAIKGEMTPEQMEAFLLFMRSPLMATAFETVTHRLATWGKLVAGKRKAEMLARNDGQMPQKKPKIKPTPPPLIRHIDNSF